MQFDLMRAVCSSLLRRGTLLGKCPRDLQAGSLELTALLISGSKYIRVQCRGGQPLQCSHMSAFQRLICPAKLPMRAFFRSAFLVCFTLLLICDARKGLAQFGIPGLGGKSGQSSDQKANQLLHQHLPLVLDANNAYPTVPDQDMLGGPFHPRTLPITLNTLTKPLPPGDYVLPMTFFCSEYSVHRGGNGIAYQLGPAQGTAAKAISTLLWRGMLTGHKPQELQSVSWAIQGSVAYDKMPPKYRALVDQLIPEMKNQVNGQAFADIEDGFQGKVNKITKKISEGIGKGTGGFVHADIKVDVELNQSFKRLGQVGRSALDGEKLNTIFTAAFPSDEARDQALYAGQGQQTAALPAANGPWSVKVPGVAYMRFIVHGGNLQGDNVMQIRILPPRTSQAWVDERPHLVLAGYDQTQQSTPSSPSVIALFNGSVNQAALSQCQATPVNQQVCSAQAVSMDGEMCYSIGTGAQACIATPSQPISASSSQPKIKITKLIYDKVFIKGQSAGLCTYFGATLASSDGSSQNTDMSHFRWVQRISTSDPLSLPDDQGKPSIGHDEVGDYFKKCDNESTDPCEPARPRPHGTKEDSPPYYRPSEYEAMWHTAYPDYGYVLRDLPSRTPLKRVPADTYLHFTTTLVKDGDFANPVATIKWGWEKSGNNDIKVDPMLVTLAGNEAIEDDSVPLIYSQDRRKATILCDASQILKYADPSGKNNAPLIVTDPPDVTPTPGLELRVP